MNDRIFIDGLRFDAIVGIRPDERQNPQPVVIDIDMTVSTRHAAESGAIDDTVSYSDVARQVQTLVEDRRFELLETLAERCAALVLGQPGVRAVLFSVKKPEAVANADAVGVRIYRSR